MQSSSLVGRGPWLHAASPCWNQKSEKEATVEGFTSAQKFHTLDKNGSLYDPAGTESCDMQIRLVSYLDKDEYMYIYIYI